MKSIYLIPGLIALSLSTGCATVMDGSTDSVSVNATGCDSDRSAVHCELENNDGVVHSMAPGTAVISKSSSALAVRCESNDGATGNTMVESSYNAKNVGNILIGGGVGVIVDAVSGAMWKYPKAVNVPMRCADDGLAGEAKAAGGES